MIKTFLTDIGDNAIWMNMSDIVNDVVDSISINVQNLIQRINVQCSAQTKHNVAVALLRLATQYVYKS